MIKSLSLAGLVLGANLSFAHAATMATGEGHSAVIRGDKSLWTWGNNDYGQTGQGGSTGLKTPLQVGSDLFTDVACGAHHTIALDQNGNVWTWGHNGFGQLAAGDTTPQNVPTQITSPSDLPSTPVAVAAGDYSTYLLKFSGALYVAGRNNAGQLGLGNTTNQHHHVQIPFAQKISKIAAGPDFALAITAHGNLMSWGSNGFGQLGLGDKNQRNSPTQVGLDGDWVDVACGGSHVLALKSNGDLYAWGNDHFGQTGLGNQMSPALLMSGVKFISAGREHSLVLKNGLELWSKGRSQVGQLGRGLVNNGDGQLGQVGGNDWFSVVTGRYHNLALKADGQLYAWGQNALGQTATGDRKIERNVQPVMIAVDPFPSVQVSPVKNVTSGENLALSTMTAGSGSLTTTWEVVAGPGGTTNLSYNGVTTQFYAGIPATYTLMATVSDGVNSSQQSLTVHIQSAVFGKMKWGVNSWNAGEVASQDLRVR